MIKKGVLFLLLILVPKIVLADAFYADVYIRENGDIEVHEATVKNGTYNYLQRDIVFGYADDNEMYSAKNLVLNRICESDKDNPLNNIGSCFMKVDNATVGNSLVYIESRNDAKVRYTLYNTNENKSAFYMEYTFKNAFVAYNDLNEALITLFDKENRESFANMEIKVYYPTIDDNNLGWIHGPVWSEKELFNDYLAFKVKDFPKFSPLEIRVVTPKDATSTSRLIGANRKDVLLDLENDLEEKKTINQKMAAWNSFGDALIIIIGAFVCTFYVLGLGVLVIKHYFSKDKEVSANFNKEYFTEFPSNDSPAAIEYLFNHNVTLNSFKAAILYIIYKKGFLVKMYEDDFELIVNDKKLVEKLTDNELELRDFLVSNYGNGKAVKLYDINKILKDDKALKIFKRNLSDWREKEITPKIKKRFYENSSFSSFTVMYCIAPFFIGLLGVIYLPLFVIMLLSILSFPVLFYLSFSIRRTKEGNELYYRWRAIRLFMEDLVTYKDNLPKEEIWGKYLAYAKVFGQSKMIASNIIEKMGNKYVNVYGIDANEYILLVDMLNNVFAMNV